MKKFLAVLMSIVMMFTLVAMPASAADEATDEITLEEFISTVELTVELIKDTLIKVHYIVGTILGMLEKECPLCGEAHEVDFVIGDAAEDETVEDEIIEDEAPEAAPELAA